MTARLHMKLGVIAEAQRPPDSPDTVLVVATEELGGAALAERLLEIAGR